MDGLSAVSLAGNVAQFLEYGIRIARTTQEIARSRQGVSKKVAEVKTILGSIEKSMKSVKDPGGFGDGDDQSEETLRVLVQSCVELCPEITRIVECLRLKDNTGATPVQALRILRKAAQTLSQNSELDKLTNRLFNLRSQVSAHLIILIE